MNLNIPKEPIEIKKWIQAQSSKGSGSGIDFDSLNVWFGNQLPKYLWQEWKDELKKAGFNWQKFLKLLKYRTDQIILWSNENMAWEALIREIIKLINGPLGEHITKKV